MAEILDTTRPGIHIEWGAPWKEGVRELAGFFENLPDEVIKDLRPVWDIIEPEISTALQQNFAAEGARGGHSKWKELSPRYKAWKVRKGFSERILVKTGRMRKAATIRGAPGNVNIKTPNMMAWGIDPTNFPGWYPMVHDIGSKSGRIPQREFMRLYPEDTKEIVQKTWKALYEKIGDYLHTRT